MTQDRFTVEHRAEEGRYVLVDRGEGGAETEVIGEESYVDLSADGATQRIFFHTFVSDEYAGQGLGSMLVRAAVEHVVSLGYQVVPVCPYVAAWLKKNPDFAEHGVATRPEHLRAVSERQR